MSETMKERKMMILALLAIMMLPMKMFAQKDDFGMWFSVAADKKINSKWSVGVESEFRTRDDMKTADRWSMGVDGGYKVTDWLKASAGYTLLYDNNEKYSYSYYDDPEEDYDEDDDGNLIPYGYTGKVKRYRIAKYWGVRHRFNVSLTGSVTLGRLKVSLRERWQYTYRPEKTADRETYRYVYDLAGNLSDGYPVTESDSRIYKGKGKNVLRSRLSLDYNIPRCKVDPFVSVETYNAWSLEKTRYTVGADWKIAKPHTVSFYYRYQNVNNNDDVDDEPNMHIVGLEYKFKF